MKKEIKSIICISDTHFGCKMGLCPPTGAPMDGGGGYTPSRPQRVVWEWWREFWQKWVPMVTEGQPYSVVHNGDVIDGNHHNSTTQFSHDLEDQGNLAVSCMGPIVANCTNYYHVRGTEAHVGQSGVEEERVAKRLGAIKNKYGQSARFDLWLNLGAHRIHFLHHVGTTGSSAHESSAVNAELTAEFVEAARWGTKPPSCIVRSHRHSHIEVRIPTGWGSATATVTPGWQLKTPFCYKIAGARLKPPQFGGVLLRLDKYGELYTKAFIRSITQD